MSHANASTPPAALPAETDRNPERVSCELSGWDDPAARLTRSLEQDELVLYGQPILALHGPDEFPMAEVLVRLREEEQALLPPGEFFPVFEHFGMMPQLDRWVVRHALARLARGSRVPRLSINISAQTLGDDDFVASVAGDLAQARIAPAALVFEVDESDALARPESSARFAAAAKSIGCGVLIDGFGRRAVSFAPLAKIRADFVKVDGVIVRKLASSAIARSKLRAIVRVGQAIGLGVIGECVEEQIALNLLRSHGAGYAQGFGIRVPAALDSIAERGA